MTELSTDRRFHSLTQEQVQTLDQVLTEVIPIHGRGNFPTLEVKPKDIIHMVKGKLIEKGIKLRDVRLNGSTASHVLVKENGTSYKDLDIIFGVELPQQEDFQIIKDVVLRCLLDFLPRGVNKDKITVLTMKEAYVQKMVKVFTEHDRWSLISLSNNSGKNVELKFVNSLRRQFEFSVDSFQIILDRMLESYLEAERRQGPQLERPDDRAPEGQRSSKKPEGQAELPSVSPDQDKPLSLDKQPVGGTNVSSSSSGSTCCFDDAEMKEEEPLDTIEEPVAEMADTEKVTETSDMEDITEPEDMEKVTEMEHVAEMNALIPASDLEPQKEVNLLEKKTEIEGKDMTEIENIHSPESSSLKEIVQNVTSTEAAISSNTAAQVHLENSTTHIDSTISHSVPVKQEKTTEGHFTLKVKCKSPCQSYACISEESSDTECTLPPPAKKTYKSQMVVLKYSSPAPPRKMSKKVTNVVSFPVKTNPPDEPSVASQTLNLTKASSVESIPMVVDVTGPETNHCKSRTQTLQNKDCQVKLLSIVDPMNTANITENGTDSQEGVTFPQRPSQEFIFPSFEVTSKSNETGIKQLSDKGLNEKIPAVEVEPPSPQALEYLVEMPKSVTLVPEHTTLTSESVVKVSQRVTEVPEFTENKLESSPLVLEFTECILESGPQIPEFTEHTPESVQQVPKFTEHELESVPQVPEVTEHNQESGHEVPDFSVQVKEASSSLAELPAHMHDCTTQTSNELQLHTESCDSRVSGEPNLLGPDAQVLGSDVQKPVTKVDIIKPVLQEPESEIQLTLSNDQGEVPDAPRLDSVHQVAEPMSQSEKPRMETAPHIPVEEAKIPARDLSGITVVAESMYGDFEQAMDHLRYRLIATRNPEEIRGGGLLKYSNLLVREFKPASETEIKTLERYMCSRFFIDFPDVNEQQRKIESYLRNHFIGEEKSKYDYLMTLRRVVNESTVCLMGHERRQTLNMITVLALKVLGEQNIIPSTTNVTCYYQPAPYMADHSFNNYYIAHGQPPLFYQPYPLHIHMQTGLV